MKTTRSMGFEQKRTKRIPAGVVLAIAMMGLGNHASAALMPVDLGSNAPSFAVLAGGGITVAGAIKSTVINGDIGTFPYTAITGIENVTQNGINYAGDGVTQDAKLDLTAAYLVAAGETATQTYGGVPYDLGESTLFSGVYHDDSSFAITGTLTLDGGGNSDSVWIFQTGSTLDTAANSHINLINGAQAGNVFWQVGSSATLGSDSVFSGTIMALDNITLTTGATVDGRVLARNGYVALDNNTISVIPEPASVLLLGVGAAMVFALRRQGR